MHKNENENENENDSKCRIIIEEIINVSEIINSVALTHSLSGHFRIRI